MKFGARLRADLYPQWAHYYLPYSDLKHELKTRLKGGRTWTADDETTFTQQLEEQLEKIGNFQDAKTRETEEGIEGIEKELAILSDGEETHHGLTEEEVELKFFELGERLAILIADVHDLAGFTRLNHVGFLKIAKKHDKRTGWKVKPKVVSMLNERPFFKENYERLIVRLSRSHDMVRTKGHPVEGNASAGGSQGAFVRQTTKYWIHPDNVTTVKLLILQHLPVLVFDAKKKFESSDAAISSIYFDNRALELYLGRIEKTEGAEAIRLRWYGGMDVKQIFVERKTHREDWTGEKSVKARFPIKEENVNSFLRGDFTMEDTFKELRAKKKKTDKEIDQLERLATEVQYNILTRRYEPVVRTFYNRTAFQLPGDARVRISLDTELTLIREDNWDGVARSGGHWRRMDIGIDYPFNQLPEKDIVRFPYAVLEVKLQTQFGQEPPLWIRELIQSHLVEAVPKFSKFTHGISSLHPDKVKLIPFWLPQMETDIRKPPTSLRIERPTPQASTRSTTPAYDEDKMSLPSILSEPMSDDDDDPDQGMPMSLAANEEQTIGLPDHEVQRARDARTEREAKLQRLRDQQGDVSTSSSTTSLTGAHAAAKAHKRRIQQEVEEEADHDSDEEESEEEGERESRIRRQIEELEEGGTQYNERTPLLKGTGPRTGLLGAAGRKLFGKEEPTSEAPHTVFARNFTAPRGTKIAIPVRIEPKVSFANERTFLKWIEFAVYLSTVAVTLLNFARDEPGLIMATAFVICALLTITYSGGVFYWRAIKIRNREAVNYHDYVGPTGLCLILVVATAIAFSVRFGAKGGK